MRIAYGKKFTYTSGRPSKTSHKIHRQIIQEGEVQTLGHEFEAAIHKWTIIFFTGVSPLTST